VSRFEVTALDNAVFPRWIVVKKKLVVEIDSCQMVGVFYNYVFDFILTVYGQKSAKSLLSYMGV